MIIVDVNILIYAINRDAPLHARAKAWLEAALSGTETIGIPWAVLLAFLRLTTRAGIFRHPMQLDAAFDVIDSWLEQPSVIIVEPGPRHRQILRGLLSEIGRAGTLHPTRTWRRWRSNIEPNSVLTIAISFDFRG